MNEPLVNPQIVQDLGPVHAVIQAVLLSHDSGEGAVMSYKEIATQANTTVASSRRAVAKLVELGYLKIEAQIEPMTGQTANRYHVSSVWSQANLSDPPAQSEQAYQEIKYLYPVVREGIGSTSSITDLTNSEVQIGSPSETRPGGSGSQDDFWEPHPIRWTPKGSPMPVLAKPRYGRKGPFRARAEAKWLVSYFEGYVLAVSNKERLAKGWKIQDGIPERRKLIWLKHAEILLADHPLAEVAGIVNWVFDDCAGILPFDVIDSYGQRRKDGERKVTSVRKILENYEQLWGARSMGTTTHTREINYGKPLANKFLESLAAQLVAAFADFRASCDAADREIHPSRRFRWMKDFRRLLDEHHLDSADLFEVIAGLKRHRHAVEHQRYREPRELHRDATEWEWVRHRVKLCQLREDLQRRTPPDAKSPLVAELSEGE